MSMIFTWFSFKTAYILNQDRVWRDEYNEQWHISAVWETGIPTWEPKLWRRKSTFQVFFFQFFFNKKLVEVAINDFKMHLFRNSLEYKKCRQKGKTMRQRGQSERRNCQLKCFHLLNYVINHASISTFLYINSLHCFVFDSSCTNCCIFSAQIAS